ncbi:uncharacterized protein LOC122320275 [Drosophila ficusphila]|uniref:uncharacterized protein LOC122320275 n=1 Tax=Drosophila ficusphila TaxID=30025 RepID=UPI001C8AEB79|nr:uncharacterized protein LOC122320275 [Drosophila ficusphila]
MPEKGLAIHHHYKLALITQGPLILRSSTGKERTPNVSEICRSKVKLGTRAQLNWTICKCWLGSAHQETHHQELGGLCGRAGQPRGTSRPRRKLATIGGTPTRNGLTGDLESENVDWAVDVRIVRLPRLSSWVLLNGDPYNHAMFPTIFPRLSRRWVNGHPQGHLREITIGIFYKLDTNLLLESLQLQHQPRISRGATTRFGETIKCLVAVEEARNPSRSYGALRGAHACREVLRSIFSALV